MVAGILEGIRRTNATKPTAAKGALLTKHIRKALKIEPTKPAAIRDRAMVLLGYAGAFRRSELVAIDVEHLTFDDEGRVRVMLPKRGVGD
jgi:site-specific recombinase XerC